MISKVSISNFKSIYKQDIELGRVNVFIGENGCGKSNILEAIAMVAASKSDDLSTEGLFNKGVRVTKPSLTFSSFLGQATKSNIQIKITNANRYEVDSDLSCVNPDDIYSLWKDNGVADGQLFSVEELASGWLTQLKTLILDKRSSAELPYDLNEQLKGYAKQSFLELGIPEIVKDEITPYLIYNINTNALRGISNESRKQPLGINGEGLDILLSTFTKEQMAELKQYNFISWLKDIHVDTADALKVNGYKLGRSTSDLYFTDKYMQKKNNMFAAENANEGALHVLFYLALLMSDRTPKFFAIDNIENALNPMLCRQLMKSVTELAKKYGKQVLITTHNPAILDGLNLHDEEQHLFVVKRSDEGHTKVERLKLKPNVENESLKLSELWMRGYLGAVPSNLF